MTLPFTGGIARTDFTPQISIGLDPAYSALSLMMMATVLQSNPGLHPWVAEVERQMDAAQRHTHETLFKGMGVEVLSNLVPADVLARDFDAYLDAIAEIDPDVLCDRARYWLLHSVHQAVYVETPPLPDADPVQVMATRDSFASHVYAHMVAIDEDVKGDDGELDTLIDAVYDLLTDSSRLRNTLLMHVRWMWDTHVAVEWARVEPSLQQSARALATIDTAGLAPMAAIHAVTGRDLNGILDPEAVSRFVHVRLIPSQHSGPFVAWGGDHHTLRIVFTARVPSGTLSGDSQLDNAELLNRFNSLADATRLDILRAVRASGELSTQQIIDQFNLDKSAASRHLRNLRASGFLIERRDSDNKTKFYQLDPGCVDGVLNALRTLLG